MVRTKTLKIRSVFRPSDEDAVTVLRLLAVANDLLTMVRLMPAGLPRRGRERTMATISRERRSPLPAPDDGASHHGDQGARFPHRKISTVVSVARRSSFSPMSEQ